jgi:mannose-6-phosphate isomerase-like protein (cupin superfamily)
MGAVDKSVRVVPLDEVEAIPLPKDSKSWMVLTGTTVPGTGNSLGYSIFKPGTVTTSVSHAVEELAYVLSGHGELRLDDGVVPFGPNKGLYIPAGVWHAVAVTGDEDVIMVFTFAYPDYPPTERK